MIPDDRPTWVDKYASIDVDITSLHEFAAVVKQDLEENFKAAWTADIQPYIDQGAIMGNTCMVPDLLKVRAYYEKCLTQIHQTMGNFYLGTAALANAAELIGKRYEGSDAFAAERQDQVKKDIDAALPPPPPPPRHGHMMEA